ncbi:unnamed protein product, partial [Symbiodinium necroappetens]
LGGPGKSWRRSGTGWVPVDTKCAVLESAEERVLVPWAFMGAFPGHQDRHQFFTNAFQAQRADCSESRRPPRQRRPRRYKVPRGRARARRTGPGDVHSEGRWYGMTDEEASTRPTEVSVLELLDELQERAPAVQGLRGQLNDFEFRASELLLEMEAEEGDEDLPGLMIYGAR